MISLLMLPAVNAKTAIDNRQTIVNSEPSIITPQSTVPTVTEADWRYNFPAKPYLALPSPDGKTALIGSDGNVYPLVDLETAQVKQIFHTEAWLRTAAFSPDGTTLLLHNNLYDVAAGAKIQTFVTGGNVNHTPQAGDISPDGTKALVMQGENVYYYDIPSGDLLQVYTYTSNINEVGFARFSPDGTQFTVGGTRSASSHAVWVSSVYTTTPVFFKQMPDVYGVHSAIFDTAGQRLLVAEAGSHLINGRLRCWNIASGVEEYNYVNMNLRNMHDIDIITATITQTLIAAGGQAGSSSVKTVDYNTGGVMMSENAYNMVESVRFVPDSDNLIISTQTNVFLINRHTGEIVRELHASVGPLNDIASSPDGDKIALAGMRRHSDYHPAPLMLVDNQGSLLHRFGEVANSNSIAFSPDGRYLLVGTIYGGGSLSGQVHLFDVDSYERVRTYDLGASFANEHIYQVAFASDGRWLVAAGHDDIFIFDTASGAILQHIQHGSGELGGLAISLDNTKIAVGKTKIYHNTNHDSVFLWNVATGQLIRSFKSDWTFDVAFSPDGSKLAAAGGEDESLVKVWEIISGDELRSFNPGHNDKAYAVAFSPDGSQLLTGGAGSGGVYQAKLWDYASGELLRKFTHNYIVNGVGFISDGTQILTRQLETSHYISNGGIGRLWSLDTLPLRQPIVDLSPGVSQSGTVEQFTWADYVIETPAGANLLITVTLQNTASLRLYGRLAEQPTLGFSDYRALETTAGGSYQLLIPNTQAGKYYIGVYGDIVADTQANFTILAQFKDRHLADVTPRSAGNAGDVTLQISGLGFEESGMAAGLYQNDIETVAGMVTVQDSTALAARFNLSGTLAGTYDLRLTWDDTVTAELKSAFVISGGVGPLLQSELSVAPFHRPDRQYVAQIRYQNVGGGDMSAPLYHLSTSGNAALICGSSTYTGATQVLGIPTTGDARYLPPGSSGQIPLQYTGLQDDMGFQLDVLFPTQTAIVWDDHKDAMRPSNIDAAEWESIFQTLTGQLGNTWASYLGVLGYNAQRLRERGDIAYCVSDHLDLEIRQAQGLPTAAIAGTLQAAATGQARGSVIVTAYDGDDNYYRDETNFVNGHFTLENLPTGVYTITAEGYYFSPTLTIQISGDQDVTDRAFLAYPVPIQPDESDPIVPIANHFPVLSVDAQGNAVMVWQRYGQLWTAEYSPTNHLWHHSGVVSGTLGEAPSLTYSANVAGGDPGFTALWRSGTGNSGQLHYSIITRSGDGDLLWHEPITLTNFITGTAGDTAPAIVAPDNGDPLALWLRRNWDIQDDTDLYYRQFNPPALQKMRLLVIVPADELEEFKRSSLAPLAEHCVSVSIKQGASLPSWVPLIGGKYGFEVSGSGCGEVECDLTVSGNLEAGVDFSDRISGSGSGNLSASWSTDVKADPCEYVFDQASLGLSAGAEGKVPAFVFSIPLIVELEAGAVINGEVAGSVYWKGGNFPGYPSGGEVELTAGIGPYGTATFIKIIEAEIKGTGQVKAKYVAPSSFSFEGWCMNLNASAKAWILSYSFDKSWGTACSDSSSLVLRAAQNFDSRQMMLSVNHSMRDDVPITEILTIQVAEQVGTGNVYTGANLMGSPVLSHTITSDLTNDGNPAVAQSGNGEILVAWTKDSQDQDNSVGSSVVVAKTTGVTFTLPVTVAGTDHFNKHVDVAFENADTPMVVWSGADASTINLSSSYTDVLDAIDVSDIYYTRRVSDTWSAPAKVATLSGTDENTRLAADGNGNVVVVWTHINSESDDDLYTAFWNGSVWSPTTIGKQSGIIESLDVVYTGAITKTPLLVWAQDTDSNPETLTDLAIFYSVYSDTVWSAPTMLEQATILQGGETAVNGAAQSVADWNLPPAQSACSASFISPPDSCCPPPEPPPDPPTPPTPGPGPQPVAPPADDGGGEGSYTVDKGNSQSRVAFDPNEKVGLAGWDGVGSIIPGTRMVYTIFFENVITATAPAQEVFITDQLSDKLDWTTLLFEEVAFGDNTLAIEGDGGSFQTQALVNDYRSPSTNWWVDIAGQLDVNTGELGWTLRMLDPDTGLLPSDVNAGFLPPNDDTGRGEGHVTFSIAQTANLSIGTVITNQASIVFDTNPAIVTNTYLNTIGQPTIYLPLVLK
jgi:WD40 repeat protein